MMSKVSSRWVPRMLTPEQKACRQQFSEENLNMLRADPHKFVSRIITGDETWVHLHDPETKQESMQWQTRGPLLQRNFVCKNQPERSWQQFFAFGIHATQDNHYWRLLCSHNGGCTREYQTKKEWKVVGWCPAASWKCARTQVTHIAAGCYKKMCLRRA